MGGERLATTFDTIFEQFLLTVDDSKLINNLTKDCLATTLSDFLDRARAICKSYLYKDVNNCVLTKSYNESFVGDGTTTQYPLSITAIENAEIYVSIDNVEIPDCTYNFSTNTAILSATPVEDSNIYIGIYKTGYFNENYNIDEITYLARGMTIPWLEFQLQKQKHLNQMVYGKDYQIHSQANHIKEDRETINNAEQRLIRDLILYTFQQSQDSLAGSSGTKYL